MIIYVNGEQHDYAEESTVADVVKEMSLIGKKIAIELNKEILPFQQYAAQGLKAGDRLEIVHAIGGGQHDSFYLLV